MDWCKNHLNWTWFIAYSLLAVEYVVVMILNPSNNVIILLFILVGLIVDGWIIRQKGRNLLLWVFISIFIGIMPVLLKNLSDIKYSPRQKKGYTNIEAIFELDPPVTYPNEGERWANYGAPMTHGLKTFFPGGIGVHWYQNEQGKMDGFSMACFGPSKQALTYMEKKAHNGVVDVIFDHVAGFWEPKGTSVKLKTVGILGERDFEQYAINLPNGRQLPYKQAWNYNQYKPTRSDTDQTDVTNINTSVDESTKRSRSAERKTQRKDGILYVSIGCAVLLLIYVLGQVLSYTTIEYTLEMVFSALCAIGAIIVGIVKLIKSLI